jgi:hypothetical protein
MTLEMLKRGLDGANTTHDVGTLEESTRCVGMQRRLEEVDEVGRSGQTGVLLRTISTQLGIHEILRRTWRKSLRLRINDSHWPA